MAKRDRPNHLSSVPRSTGQDASTTVDGSDGGGDDGNMDRIEKLESAVKRLEADTSAVKADVSSVKDSINDVKVLLAKMDAKMDIDGVRAFVERSHTDVYKWVATLLFSSASLGAVIYFGMHHLSK
ncbi:hypothetical protein [Burkholderia gladioli]|uniref:hypothetical protein n=1 Tax=Burkholderia gladioli TaxID=28095 RepID=UPI00164056F8|nr:hypothetical protein [Burkholderia gladioli]